LVKLAIDEVVVAVVVVVVDVVDVEVVIVVVDVVVVVVIIVVVVVVVEVGALDHDEPAAAALVLRALGLLRGFEARVAVGVEVAVLLDVAAVEVGHALGRAQRDVDEEGHGLRLAVSGRLGDELAEGLRDVGVRGEDLLKNVFARPLACITLNTT